LFIIRIFGITIDTTPRISNIDLPTATTKVAKPDPSHRPSSFHLNEFDFEKLPAPFIELCTADIWANQSPPKDMNPLYMLGR
jgi:hypothetical protein